MESVFSCKNNQSCVIVGKGPSILKTNPDYINSFTDTIICNKPVWGRYEKYIPKKARVQFANNSTDRFTEDEIKELGLQEIISSAYPGEQLNVPEYYHRLIKITYPDLEPGPNKSISVKTSSGKTFSPSTGIQAFKYAIESGKYEKIAMVGFDLLTKGDRAYYFEPHEIQSNLDYLFDDGTLKWEGFIYNTENGHDHHALEYIMEKIENNPSLSFEFTTTSDVLIDALKNFKNAFFMETNYEL